MARHDGRLSAGAHEPLELEEVIGLLSDRSSASTHSREDAIARYLAAAEGWSDAAKLLGGAFAGGSAGLKARKDD